MRMNSGIILSGQQPDLVNALARGTQAAEMANSVQRNNALFPLQMQQERQGIQQNALAMDNTRQIMQARGQQMQMAQAEASRLDQLRQKQEQINKVVGIMRSAQTPEEWDQLARTYGDDEMVGQFGNQDALITMGMTELEKVQFEIELEAAAAEANAPMSPQGKLFADLQAGRITQEQFDTASAPKGPLVDMSGANIGTNQSPDALLETMDKAQGTMFSNLIENGMNIPAKRARIDQLEQYLANETTPEGIEAALKAFAGDLGIATEGLDTLQAARGIINSLVPEQRAPGSGPMSDADLELFKQSLPRLINTRDGNLMILRTLRGLAQYEAAQAQVAGAVASREISATEARKALSELENPLQVYRQQGDVSVGGGFDPDVQGLIDRYAD